MFSKRNVGFWTSYLSILTQKGTLLVIHMYTHMIVLVPFNLYIYLQIVELSLFVSRFTICHKTEVIKNNLNPVWQPFTIPVRALCNGDYDRWGHRSGVRGQMLLPSTTTCGSCCVTWCSSSWFQAYVTLPLGIKCCSYCISHGHVWNMESKHNETLESWNFLANTEDLLEFTAEELTKALAADRKWHGSFPPILKIPPPVPCTSGSEGRVNILHGKT